MAEHGREQEEFLQFSDGISALTGYSSLPNPWLLFAPRIILPLSDNVARRRTPGITLTILGFNVAVYLFTLLRVTNLEAFVFAYGLIPSRVLAGEQGYALITYMFLHAGLIHLLGNMLFLWIFSDNVEDAFGHLGFIPLYLACGIAAVGLHMAFHPTSAVPCIGASGAVAGMMGAYFVLYPKARVRTFVFFVVIPVPTAVYIAGWFAMQLLFGALYTSLNVTTGVAWFAHIGGLLSGAIIAGIFKALGIVPIARREAAG